MRAGRKRQICLATIPWLSFVVPLNQCFAEPLWVHQRGLTTGIPIINYNFMTCYHTVSDV